MRIVFVLFLCFFQNYLAQAQQIFPTLHNDLSNSKSIVMVNEGAVLSAEKPKAALKMDTARYAQLQELNAIKSVVSDAEAILSFFNTTNPKKIKTLVAKNQNEFVELIESSFQDKSALQKKYLQMALETKTNQPMSILCSGLAATKLKTVHQLLGVKKLAKQKLSISATTKKNILAAFQN
jgi:hypothetical protein